MTCQACHDRKAEHVGQMTIGILYGAEAPALPVAGLAYNEPLYELLCRFHAAAGLAMYPPFASDQLAVRQEATDAIELLGIWVAVGGSGVPGAAFFLAHATRLVQLETLYADVLVQARALWERFAAYCTEQEHLTLPLPELWIMPTEVA